MPRSLKEFIDAAKLARRSSERVFVVLHLFSGANRDFDLEWHVRHKLASKNLKVLVISVDLGADLNWDLGDPETFHVLHESVVQGLVGAVCGGPPMQHLVPLALQAQRAQATTLSLETAGAPGCDGSRTGSHCGRKYVAGQLYVAVRSHCFAWRSVPVGTPGRPWLRPFSFGVGDGRIPQFRTTNWRAPLSPGSMPLGSGYAKTYVHLDQH